MATNYSGSSIAFMEPFTDALPILPPQFDGGGPTVRVRNTFLDIDDRLPDETALVRAHTAPPGGARTGHRVGMSSSDEDDDAVGPPQHDENTEGNLERTVTRDWYESREDWSWVDAACMSPSDSHQQGIVPVVTPPTTTVAAWPEGNVQPLPRQEPPPPPTTSPRVTGDEWAPAPVSSESRAVPAVTPAWPPPASVPLMVAVPPTAPTMASGSSDAVSLPSVIPAAQPQTLTRDFCVITGCFRTLWWVDARKLRGNDKQAVSPPFEMSSGDSFPGVTFKMMIYPKVMNDQKGGASFKKARGKGLVQLKCEAELSEATANFSFRISIGTGENKQAPRGPKVHNFAASAVCGLDKDEEEWDFQSVVDPESMTFVVCLEIAPLADARLGKG